MIVVHAFDIRWWDEPRADATCARAIAALEAGSVLHFPELSFVLAPAERPLLTPMISDGRAKNISLDPDGRVTNAAAAPEQHEQLQAMMRRFANAATALVRGLFPRYAPSLECARTSYRPVEIAGRVAERLTDDSLLHVDAFPTRPMRGRRILRVFSNVDPAGRPRVWHVGEPFESMAQRFLPRVSRRPRLERWRLAAVGATKGLRSRYDELMLGLHDAAKCDERYQRDCARAVIAFAAGSTWLCFTDQVMHAAVAGQFALEQTFHVDPAVMADRRCAPVSVLRRLQRAALLDARVRHDR